MTNSRENSNIPSLDPANFARSNEHENVDVIKDQIFSEDFIRLIQNFYFLNLPSLAAYYNRNKEALHSEISKLNHLSEPEENQYLSQKIEKLTRDEAHRAGMQVLTNNEHAPIQATLTASFVAALQEISAEEACRGEEEEEKEGENLYTPPRRPHDFLSIILNSDPSLIQALLTESLIEVLGEDDTRQILSEEKVSLLRGMGGEPTSAQNHLAENRATSIRPEDINRSMQEREELSPARVTPRPYFFSRPLSSTSSTNQPCQGEDLSPTESPSAKRRKLGGS